MILDLTWRTDYDVRVLTELPGTPRWPVFYYPPVGKGGHDGLWLEISRGMDRWLGCFAFNSSETSAVIAAPKSGWLVVIAEGSFAVVNTADPVQWETSRLSHVRTCHVSLENRLILIGDYTNMAAYGPEGFLWTTGRLCWDDLQIIGVEGSTIVATGYNPADRNHPEGRIILDLFTGKTRETDFDERLFL